MCNHVWKTVNEWRVCMRCGLTVNKYSGRPIFDRKLPNIIRIKEGRKRREK